MADPTTVPCPKKAWTKVATSVTNGNITNQIQRFYKPDVYYTWVDTGNDAPTLSPGSDGNLAAPMETRFLPFKKTYAIDIYIWPAKRDTDFLIEID